MAAILRDMQALLAGLERTAHQRRTRPLRQAGPGTAGRADVSAAFESALAGALFPDAIRPLF